MFGEEETRLGGYEADEEREVFFRGRDWGESEVEAEKVNQVYEVEEAPQSANSGRRGNQAEEGGHGWTQVTRQRWRRQNRGSLEAEKPTLKAEKDNAEGRGKVKAVQDARVKIAKPGRRNLKAEAERMRGARADGVPPPTNQRPRRKQQSQPTVEEQGQIQQ